MGLHSASECARKRETVGEEGTERRRGGERSERAREKERKRNMRMWMWMWMWMWICVDCGVCYVMLCYMLCYVMLCYVMLCYAMVICKSVELAALYIIPLQRSRAIQLTKEFIHT